MGKIKYTKEFIEPLIANSTSWKDLFMKLGTSRSNGTHAVIRGISIRYNIDISHLNNRTIFPWKKREDTDVFCENSEVDRSTVKNRILSKNLILYECKCGNKGEWLGQKMSLVLDHINGINNDNRLSNLRFICPNCDAVSPTYKNKNKNINKIKKSIQNKNILKIKKIEVKKEKILKLVNEINNLNIDMTKYGWGVELASKINLSPQWCMKFIKDHMPEKYKICYKHKIKDI